MTGLLRVGETVLGGFGEPRYLGVAAIALLVIGLGLWSHAVRRRRLARFLGGRRAAERLASTDLFRFRWERLVLLGAAAVALGVAAADPLWRVSPSEAPPPPPERQLMVALDVSASMQAPDETPTRLSVAVELAKRIISDAGNQKVGLILFAGESYLLSPPTADFRVLDYLLSGVTATIASAQDPGTRLSAAIAGAGEAFAYSGAAGQPVAIANQAPPIRSIVVVSDGDSGETETEIAAALESVVETGATVHTIRLGGTAGSPMTMPRGQYQLGGPVLAADGSRAISRARPALLARVAELGGGVFVDAPEEGLAPLFDRLRPPVEPPLPAAGSEYGARLDPTAWLVAVALAAIILESLLDVRVPRLARTPRRRFV